MAPVTLCSFLRCCAALPFIIPSLVVLNLQVEMGQKKSVLSLVVEFMSSSWSPETMSWASSSWFDVPVRGMAAEAEVEMRDVDWRKLGLQLTVTKSGGNIKTIKK